MSAASYIRLSDIISRGMRDQDVRFWCPYCNPTSAGMSEALDPLGHFDRRRAHLHGPLGQEAPRRVGWFRRIFKRVRR